MTIRKALFLHVFSTAMFVVLLLGFANPATAQCADSVRNITQKVVREIQLFGNKTTKAEIIRRELLFKEGDILSENQLFERCEKSEKLLMNTGLFNFASVLPVPLPDSDSVDIHVHVTEQWYIFPIPQVLFADRNINTWLQSSNKSLLSLGVDFRFYNFRGRKEMLRIYPLLGYDNQLLLDYEIPFLNRKMKMGLLTGGYFTLSHSIIADLKGQLSVLSPQIKNYAKQAYAIYMGLNYRPHIYVSHRVKLQYEYECISDTVWKTNPRILIDSLPKSQIFSFSYFLKVDHRDYAAYPLVGRYFDAKAQFSQSIHIQRRARNFSTIRSTFRHYGQLFPRTYYAFAANGFWCSTSSYPFSFREASLGFDRFYVRGYEDYLFKAQAYFLWKSNIKYAILKDKIFHLPMIKNEAFSKIPFSIYMNVFSDVGYAYDRYYHESNPLENEWIFGYGIGVDFVTYYQQVFRMEATLNRQHQFGIYFSFLEPI